jgi:mannose-1-phosphate guanylyltransferase
LRRALILAGGLGERLRPLTDRLPKPLAPVLNRPVVSWVISQLREAGYDEIGVTAGYRGDQLRRHLASFPSHGLDLMVLDEPRPLGTGGTLCAHSNFLQGEPCLVVTADMLSSLDLRAMATAYEENPTSVMVAVADQDGSTWPGDTVDTDQNGMPRYSFKPRLGRKRVKGSAGTWIVDPDVVDDLGVGEFVDFSRDVLPTLPTKSFDLGVYDAGKIELFDIGTLDRLLETNLDLATRGPSIVGGGGGTKRAEGAIVVGEDVVVDGSAQILAPAVIGDRVRVEAGAMIAGSVVLANSTVPADTLVAGAVYGDIRFAET